MRHDAKLGLALGMLVIGFAVAFCFPRLDSPAPLKLETPPPPISDATLALLPIRTYQSGLALPAPAAPATEEPKTTPPSDPLTPILIDGRPVTAAELALVADLSANNRKQPAPLAAAGTPVMSEQIRPQRPVKEDAPPETYLVKPGDTLSGIATRLLGSSSRYGELFTANRDLLDSPDDLKIGMRLRVPPLIPVKKDDPSELRPSATARSEPGLSRPSLPRSSLPPHFQRPPTAPWIAEEPRERHPR